MIHDHDDEADFLRRLGRALEGLMAEPGEEGGEAIGPLVRAHLGHDRAPVVTEELESWELPSQQLALDALLARDGWGGRILGVAGQGKRFSMLGLGDLVSGEHYAVGPLEYVNAPVGPGRTLACLDFAVALVNTPQGPACLFVRRAHEHGPVAGLSVQAMAADPQRAELLLTELRALREEHDVVRGQVVTVEVSRAGEHRLAFLERPRMGADELVLPAGALERIERHLVGPTRHRAALEASGRHLTRGLLLWGPPGTGKTHTVRYLLGRVPKATVILLSGASLGMVGAFAGLARRVAPSVIVLDDVDLVAEERVFGAFGSDATLFELMNEMSGIGEDADIAFVLTTNRPEALEPALAARPGRVDLAVEIPLPDAAARARLLELYARGLDARIADPEAIVARTEGMTAAFFRELLRKTALEVAEDGRRTVTDADLAIALDDLLAERSALTRVLLSGGSTRGDADDAQAWLRDAPPWPPGD